MGKVYGIFSALKRTISSANLSKTKICRKKAALRSALERQGRSAVNIENLQPFVRFAGSFVPRSPYSGIRVCARDCRLVYALENGADLTCDGCEPFRLSHGDCVYIPAGRVYCMQALAGQPGRVFVLNFDLDRSHAEERTPLPLLPPERAGEACPVPAVEDAPALGGPVLVRNMQQAEPLIDQMEREYLGQGLFWRERLNAQTADLLVQLLRAANGRTADYPEPVSRMLLFVRQNCTRRLSVEEIAARAGYHPNYANRLFLRHTGKTLHRYLTECRIRMAVDLMLTTELSLTEIAERTGFSSLSRFSHCFYEYNGYAPSRCRERGT